MSIEHCRSVCLGHIYDPLRDITCSMPVRTGKCKGKSQQLKRYYYNFKTDRCYPFIFSGCNGNDNNFETYWECLAHCRKFKIDKYVGIGEILEEERLSFSLLKE